MKSLARGRRPILVLLVVSLGLALVGCGGEQRGSAQSQSSTTVYVHAVESKPVVKSEGITAVDVPEGHATNVDLPSFGGGDPPFSIAYTGGRLVYYGGSATYAIDGDLTGNPDRLGRSWYFVPAATPGRLWLTVLDPESPPTARDLASLREVTVRGKTVVEQTAQPPCEGPSVWGAVGKAMVCDGNRGLAVFDPITGDVIRRLSQASFLVAVSSERLAWCNSACSALNITDPAGKTDITVDTPRSASFIGSDTGAFTPDESRLAVPVEPRKGRGRGLAVVKVNDGTVELVHGARPASGPPMAWSSTGESLFFISGHGDLMEYRPASNALTNVYGGFRGETVTDLAVR